jgi:hypothetical protein
MAEHDVGEQTFLPVDAANVWAVIRSTTRSFERDPGPFFGMDEENLRSCLVASLNGAFAGRATAESFNARGKADILVRSGDRNIFVGECKIYNGPAGLIDAIDQLLRYTTWRDLDLGLIVFVRSGAISAAIAGLREAAEKSEQVTSAEDVDGSGAELRLAARLPDDPDRTVHINALLVHVPIPRGRRRKKPEDVMHPEDAMEAMLDIQRSLPEDIGLRYTPTLAPDATRDESVSGWRVVVSRTTPDGTAGIEVSPETPQAMVEHGPEGALIAPDDVTARRLHESLRRTRRDLVPTDLTGVGIRLDRIPAALRDSADRLQRADPAHLSGTFGPRGLWQCMIELDTDRGTLQTPIAFAAVDPAEGWDATVRGTVFDLALSMSMGKAERDTQFEWELSPPDSPPRERLAALEFLYVYSGRGTMRITSIEPHAGNGDFNLDGFELDEETIFERQLLLNVVAIEDYLRREIEVPERLEQDWVDVVFAAGQALRSGSTFANLERVVARVDAPEGLPEPGHVGSHIVPLGIRFNVGGTVIDLGTGHAEFRARVASVRPDNGQALLELVPAAAEDGRVEVTGLPGEDAGSVS